MRCFVYKSRRKAETYVYLAVADDFERLPAPLRDALYPLDPVLEFDLTLARRLARGDSGVVLNNLLGQGFHIQFPPPIGAVVDD